MNLTMLGVGIIAGNMFGRLMFQKSVDDRRGLDITLMYIGLLLIIGSQYHLFGG
jgi:hypothetical protein